MRIELYKHLATTKKVRQPAADGFTMVEKFIKTDKQDHWVHSLNYCNIAAMACELVSGKEVVGVMPGTSTVKVGSQAEPDREKVDAGHALSGMFGMAKARTYRH